MRRLFLLLTFTSVYLLTPSPSHILPSKNPCAAYAADALESPAAARGNNNETAKRIEEWTEQLYSDDPSVSNSAAISILALGLDGSVKLLIDILNDTRNDNVRISIIKAFGFNGDDRALESAIELLDNENDAVKSAAAETLGKLNTQKAVEKMSAAMLDKNRSLSSRALLIQALGDVRVREVVEPLLHAMDSDESALRGKAKEALEKITKQSFGYDVKQWSEWWKMNRIKSREQWLEDRVEVLDNRIAQLEDRLEELHSKFALKTIEILKVRIERGDIKPLLEGMKSEYQEVRVFSARNLANFKDPAIAPILIAALSDMQKDVRIAAARGLGELGNERVVEPLINALDDEEIEVQVAAAEALGRLGVPRSVGALISALDSPESGLVVASTEALGQVRDNRAVEPLIDLLSHRDPKVKESAAFALGKLKDERCIDPLIKTLDDQEERIRWFAADSLGEIGNVESVEPLARLLSDPSARVRESAAKALGQIKSEKSIKPLLTALEDQDKRVAEQAADSLVTIDYERFESSDNLADKFYNSKDYKRAIRILQRQIKRFSGSSGYEGNIWQNKLSLARSYCHLKDWGNAIPLYEGLTEYFHDDAEIRVELARCLKETRQYERVIELYTTWIKDFSDNSQAWWQGRLDVAGAFFEGGNYQKAKELIDDFRKEDPALGGVGIKTKFDELEEKCTNSTPDKEG